MHSGLVRKFLAVALILPLAACEQNATQTASDTAPPAPAEPVPPPPPPPPVEQPPPIPPGSEMAINTIRSANLSRPADDPDGLIIRASGAALSTGWTDPRLVPEENNGANGDVMIYRFVAKSPPADQPTATPRQLDTELRVESFPDSIATVRIVSATNQISVPVAQ